MLGITAASGLAVIRARSIAPIGDSTRSAVIMLGLVVTAMPTLSSTTLVSNAARASRSYRRLSTTSAA